MESQPSAVLPLATRGRWASWRISSCQFDTHTENTQASPADPLLNSMYTEQKLIRRTNALAGTSRSSLWSEDPCKVMRGCHYDETTGHEEAMSLKTTGMPTEMIGAQFHRGQHTPEQSGSRTRSWNFYICTYVHTYKHTYNFMRMGVLPVRMSVHHMHA